MQSNNLLRAGCGKSPPKTNKICLIIGLNLMEPWICVINVDNYTTFTRPLSIKIDFLCCLQIS